MNKKRKVGFTLIELLVVIAIIGILATLAVVSLQNARKNARDAKRIADVKQMQTALELYYNDTGVYPLTGEIDSTIATGGLTYMATVPTAPTPADGDCEEGDNTYTYTSANGSTYAIGFCIGSNISGLSAGLKIASPVGVASPPPDACNNETSFVDSRDGSSYQIVAINNQCWMGENLKYDNGCSSVTWVNDVDEGWCGCKYNSLSNCDLDGRFYQWSAAMNGSVVEGDQGICPEGWHIPSFAEWTALYDYVNSISTYRCNDTSGYIAKSLGAIDLPFTSAVACALGNNPSSNNSTGLNINLYGKIYSFSGTHGDAGFSRFWSSSVFNSSNARYVFVRWDRPEFFYDIYSLKSEGYPVRCIKN